MQFRKLAAIGGSAVMTGLSLAGAAMAATNVGNVVDLAKPDAAGALHFPWFILGSVAKPEDVATAINVASRMAGESKVATAGSTTTVDADGLDRRMEAGRFSGASRGLTNSLEADTSGTNTKLALLISAKGKGGDQTADFLSIGSVSSGGTDYKWGEYINVSDTRGFNATWDQQATQTQNNFKATTIQITPTATQSGKTGSFYYLVKFDKDIPAATFLSKDIYWLGAKYVVSKVDLGSSPKEIRLGQSASLLTISAGEEQTYGDFKIKLTGADGSKATFFVTNKDGKTDTKAIDESDTQTVNGLDINVIDAYTQSGSGGTGTVGYAKYLAGAPLTAIKLKDGEQYVEGSTTYSNWQAYVTNTSAGLTQFGIYYTFTHTGSNQLSETQSVESPGKFFGLYVKGLDQIGGETATTKLKIEPNIQLSQQDIFNNINTYVVKFSSADPIFEVTGGQVSGKKSEVWLVPNISAVSGGARGIWLAKNSSDVYTTLTQEPSITWTDKSFGGGTARNSMRFYNVTADFGGANLAGASPNLDFALRGWNTSAQNSATVPGYILIREPTSAASDSSSDIHIQYMNSTATGGSANFNHTFAGGTLGSHDDAESYVTYNSSEDGSNPIYLGETGNSYTRVGFVTRYGTKITQISTSAIEMEIPKKQRGMRIIIGQSGKTKSSGGTATVVPVASDVAKLDSEVVDAAGKADKTKLGADVVVVGGPCVNKVAADLLGKTYPACGADSGIAANTALVQVFTDKYATGKVAVLIAGWEAKDTDLAGLAVQAGKITATTDKVVVKGTSLTDVTFT